MIIGIITTWFDRGAAYVSKQYREVLVNAHQVFIYARGGELYGIGDPNWDLDYVTWGKKLPDKPSTWIDSCDINNWIIENNIELIIFNEQQDWGSIIPLLNRKIIIGTYVDYYTKRTFMFYNMFDFLLCNTQRHYSVFKNFKNAKFIQWGTDTSLFVPKTENYKKAIFFHSAGIVNPNNIRKGTDLLLIAFQKIGGDCELIIHSQTPLDKYPNELQDIVNNDKRVTFINATVSAPGLYHLGNIYVYPSKLDGIGLTIPEALSCGLPVITTNNAPMNEFIVNGDNGFLIDVSNFRTRFDGYYWDEAICDIHSLKEKMMFFVNNPDLISVFSMRARRSAEEKFDWVINAAELSQEISKIKKIKINKIIFAKLIIYVISKKGIETFKRTKRFAQKKIKRIYAKLTEL